MDARKLSAFLLQTVAAGLAAGLFFLLLWPSLSGRQAPVVKIHEAPPAPQATGAGPVASYAEAVGRAAPAVVNVYTSKVVAQRVQPMFDDPVLRFLFRHNVRKRRVTSLGSGVIVSPQGYVLTNNHVIDNADQIAVALRDGRSSSAALVGKDTDTDLAVLKIDLRDPPAIVLGQSGALRVGDVVLAMGNPLAVGQSVTMGIVSATGRHQLGLNNFEDFIQTDAAINQGNSGGALVNAAGELVGINTAIISQSGGSEGIGFAIPVDLAKGVLKQIIEHGSVVRGWLGVELQDITPELAESFGLGDTEGVLIAGVLRDGPAHQAGLQPGDVITRMNDRPVGEGRELLAAVAVVLPGTQSTLTVLRSGVQQQVTVQVGSRPAGGD